jgi:hypothetical protein
MYAPFIFPGKQFQRTNWIVARGRHNRSAVLNIPGRNHESAQLATITQPTNSRLTKQSDCEKLRRA